MKYKFVAFAFILICFVISPSFARQITPTAQTTIEIGFSPDGSAELLILNAINSAQKSIRVAAYSFTSPLVAKALIKAKKRGVNIAVIVDYKQNIQMDESGKGKAALNLLVNAKIPLRTLETKNSQHSKYMIIDDLHVQTGSYNYSAAAARYNHENVVLIRNNRALAKEYLNNWQKLYEAGTQYKSSY